MLKAPNGGTYQAPNVVSQRFRFQLQIPLPYPATPTATPPLTTAHFWPEAVGMSDCCCTCVSEWVSGWLGEWVSGCVSAGLFYLLSCDTLTAPFFHFPLPHGEKNHLQL